MRNIQHTLRNGEQEKVFIVISLLASHFLHRTHKERRQIV